MNQNDGFLRCISAFKHGLVLGIYVRFPGNVGFSIENSKLHQLNQWISEWQIWELNIALRKDGSRKKKKQQTNLFKKTEICEHVRVSIYPPTPQIAMFPPQRK